MSGGGDIFGVGGKRMGSDGLSERGLGVTWFNCNEALRGNVTLWTGLDTSCGFEVSPDYLSVQACRYSEREKGRGSPDEILVITTALIDVLRVQLESLKQLIL